MVVLHTSILMHSVAINIFVRVFLQRNSKGGISEASFIVDRPSHTPKHLFKPLGTAGKTTVVDVSKAVKSALDYNSRSQLESYVYACMLRVICLPTLTCLAGNVQQTRWQGIIGNKLASKTSLRTN